MVSFNCNDFFIFYALLLLEYKNKQLTMFSFFFLQIQIFLVFKDF